MLRPPLLWKSHRSSRPLADVLDLSESPCRSSVPPVSSRPRCRLPPRPRRRGTVRRARQGVRRLRHPAGAAGPVSAPTRGTCRGPPASSTTSSGPSRRRSRSRPTSTDPTSSSPPSRTSTPLGAAPRPAASRGRSGSSATASGSAGLHDAYLDQIAAAARAFPHVMYVRPAARDERLTGPRSSRPRRREGARRHAGGVRRGLALPRDLPARPGRHQPALGVQPDDRHRRGHDGHPHHLPRRRLRRRPRPRRLQLGQHRPQLGAVAHLRGHHREQTTGSSHLHPTAPVWICEVGCKEPSYDDGAPRIKSASKGRWITDMFAATTFPRVRAVCWFQGNKERDWRANVVQRRAQGDPLRARPDARRGLRVGRGCRSAAPDWRHGRSGAVSDRSGDRWRWSRAGSTTAARCRPRRVRGEPPDPGSDPRIVLERHSEEGVETFALERRLAYRDRHLGELLVPADAGFRTDLTSVPALFTWLVPKTGAHLPAALLHDALVAGRDDPASYVSTEGHVGRPGRGRPDLPRRDGRHRHGRDPSLDRLVGGHRGDDLRRPGRAVVAAPSTGPTASRPASRSPRSSTSATARPATCSTLVGGRRRRALDGRSGVVGGGGGRASRGRSCCRWR